MYGIYRIFFNAACILRFLCFSNASHRERYRLGSSAASHNIAAFFGPCEEPIIEDLCWSHSSLSLQKYNLILYVNRSGPMGKSTFIVSHKQRYYYVRLS